MLLAKSSPFKWTPYWRDWPYNIPQSVFVAGFTKYSVNHKFLDEGLTSHRQLWFWGAFLTDGSIVQSRQGNAQGIAWNQKYNAFPMLNTIRKVTESSHPLSFHASKNSKYYMCRLDICSASLSRTMLKLLECDPARKTFDLKFPESIDAEYLSSIVRGIVDGDGCWHIRSTSAAEMWLSITSANYSFLFSIKTIINKYCLNTNQDRGTICPDPDAKKSQNCYQLFYYDTAECIQIGEWMYQTEHINDGMFLHKKYARYLLLQSVFRDRKATSPVERLKIVQQFKLDEEEADMNTLHSLISMSRNEVMAPSYFTFAPSFHQAVSSNTQYKKHTYNS
eukprot:763670_1